MSDTPNRFKPDMPMAEAMELHPRAGEVFAAFHLGGCSHCGIAEVETIEQVCAAYGVDISTLLEVLESLFEKEPIAET
jgi:hybrid cluster-associated redox disulfide protein